MKKRKFFRGLIFVLFSILLFISAALPCFAIEFDVGGGSGVGTRSDPLFCPSIRYNVHPVGSDVPLDVYYSFPFDPLFTNYVTSESFCESSGTFVNSLTDNDSDNTGNCFSTFEFYSYSGTYNYMNPGTLETYFYIDSFVDTGEISAVSFNVDQFFAWSQPIDGFNSELIIDIDLSESSFDFSTPEDWMYISFEYMPLGSYYPDSSYTYVNLPLSSFLNDSEDHLVISLDSFFNDLDSTYVIYDVRDFNFYIPVESTDFIDLQGTLTYFINPDVSVVSKLYPSPSEQMELHDYTAWITHAVEGFLFLEIFPGFYLSGFLMCILGFVMFIWALKVFAGG